LLSGNAGLWRIAERQSPGCTGCSIEPPVGSMGDSYGHALAETINGLCKAEVIHRQSRKSREAVELATLLGGWVQSPTLPPV
jgi:hypothetical protein